MRRWMRIHRQRRAKGPAIAHRDILWIMAGPNRVLSISDEMPYTANFEHSGA